MATDTSAVPRPQGNYRAATQHGGIAVSAGMTPRVDGKLIVVGTVGRVVSIDQAADAAAVAAANAVRAIAADIGGVGNIAQCLRMTVFIACDPGFTELTAVADGASRALVEILGPDLLPARSAIGVLALPGGAPVEVELAVATRIPPQPAEG